jgi:hypothetical protein
MINNILRTLVIVLVLNAGQSTALADVQSCLTNNSSIIAKLNCLETEGYGTILGLDSGLSHYTPAFKTINIEDRINQDWDTDYLMNLKSWGVSFRPVNTTGDYDITASFNFELQMLTNGGSDNTTLGITAPCKGFYQATGANIRHPVDKGQSISIVSINDIIAPMSTECPVSADTTSPWTNGGVFLCTDYLANVDFVTFLEVLKVGGTPNAGTINNEMDFNFQKNPSVMNLWVNNTTMSTTTKLDMCDGIVCVCDTSNNSCATTTKSPFITAMSGKIWSRSDERSNFLSAFFPNISSLIYSNDLSGVLDTAVSTIDTSIRNELGISSSTSLYPSGNLSMAPQNISVTNSAITSLNTAASTNDWSPTISLNLGKIWKSVLLLDNFDVGFETNDPLNVSSYLSLTTLDSLPPIRLKNTNYSKDLFKSWYGNSRDSLSQVVKLYNIEDSISTVGTSSISSILTSYSESFSDWQSLNIAPASCPIITMEEDTPDEETFCDTTSNTIHTNSSWEDFETSAAIEVNGTKCPYNAPIAAHLTRSCTSFKGEVEGLGGGFDPSTNTCIPISPVPSNLITYSKKYYNYIYKNNGLPIQPMMTGNVPASGRLVSFHIENVTSWDCSANSWSSYGWPNGPSGWGVYPGNGTFVVQPAVATNLNNSCPNMQASDEYMINRLHKTSHSSSTSNHYIIRYYWVYQGPGGDTCATQVTGLSAGGTGWPTYNNTGYADPCDAM